MLATNLPYLPTVFIYCKGKKVYAITFPGPRESFQQGIAETLMANLGFGCADYSFSWTKSKKFIEDISPEYRELIDANRLLNRTDVG